MNQSKGWIEVCGQQDPNLEQRCSQIVSEHIAKGKYSQDSVAVIAAMRPGTLDRELVIDNRDFESLRRLCQVWDVDLRPAAISSHRPVVGWVIVMVKRLLFPIIRAFLKDSLRQQRDFNAQTVSLLTELCNRTAKRS